jgi:N-acetylmuramoyl-L-alanine amidase
VSNPGDLRQLVSETWRSRVAAAIATAVHAYFSSRVAGAKPAPPPGR